MNKPEPEVKKEVAKEKPLFEAGALASKVVFHTKTTAEHGMAKISRLSAGVTIRGNAKCPCGSGKKFKRCCRG